MILAGFDPRKNVFNVSHVNANPCGLKSIARSRWNAGDGCSKLEAVVAFQRRTQSFEIGTGRFRLHRRNWLLQAGGTAH